MPRARDSLRQQATDLRAQVARLEAANAALARAGEEWHMGGGHMHGWAGPCPACERLVSVFSTYGQRGRELQAANAALAAALEVEWTYSHNSICRKRTEGHGDCLRPKPAALSDAGEARVWCERCGHRAALEVKRQPA